MFQAVDKMVAWTRMVVVETMRDSPILDCILEVDTERFVGEWRKRKVEQLKKRVTHSGTRGRLQK